MGVETVALLAPTKRPKVFRDLPNQVFRKRPVRVGPAIDVEDLFGLVPKEFVTSPFNAGKRIPAARINSWVAVIVDHTDCSLEEPRIDLCETDYD
jgi:hypothetical protein